MQYVLLVVVMLSTGCPTQFTGSAHIDPAVCQIKCDEAHLEMQGMVFLGEYSSACICEVPRQADKAPAAAGAAGAMAGGVAGVMLQTRRATEHDNELMMSSHPQGN
jgi:hypothetical protein